MKRQSKEWQKYLFMMRLTWKYSRVYNSSCGLISEKQTTQSKNGQKKTQTFLQTRHTDGQQAREKMLNIINYSVQFSCSVVSDSLWSHESQHARPPCSSPSPGVHSDLRPSSPWCHLAISSSVVPFSSGPQSLPESESFPMSQLFAWGGQSTGASALALFLPKNPRVDLL